MFVVFNSVSRSGKNRCWLHFCHGATLLFVRFSVMGSFGRTQVSGTFVAAVCHSQDFLCFRSGGLPSSRLSMFSRSGKDRCIGLHCHGSTTILENFELSLFLAHELHLSLKVFPCFPHSLELSSVTCKLSATVVNPP